MTLGGSDIGNDWEYRIIAHGVTTDIPEHTLNPGRSEGRNDSVLDRNYGETDEAVVDLVVEGIEVDTFSDDVGSSSQQIRIPCPGTKLVNVVVNVTEGGSTAILHFLFEIRATCV